LEEGTNQIFITESNNSAKKTVKLKQIGQNLSLLNTNDLVVNQVPDIELVVPL
jgi:hypothetical protein